MQPRGIRNNNIGNLKLTNIPWKGKVKRANNTDGTFEQFQDTDGVKGMVWGIRAMMKDILNDFIRDGKTTVSELITEYAPSSENNTNAYINHVSGAMGVSPNEILRIDTDKDQFIKMIRAMAFHENGTPAKSIPLSDFEKAYSLV